MEEVAWGSEGNYVERSNEKGPVHVYCRGSNAGPWSVCRLAQWPRASLTDGRMAANRRVDDAAASEDGILLPMRSPRGEVAI